MVYRWLATAALALHFGYMAYLVLGGFVAWRWPRTIWLHLGAVVWGLLIISGTVDCPLTYAENWARERAGLTRLSQGFVDRCGARGRGELGRGVSPMAETAGPTSDTSAVGAEKRGAGRARRYRVTHGWPHLSGRPA